MPVQIGASVGAYAIVSPLGAGGMGEVYRARDNRLNRDVALKVLPDSFANDPERLARFQREAQVLASLNHPNIAHIHGIEDADGVRALVMELVEGLTLADRIAQGAIPFAEALPIAKQIADALEAAHAQGIIHRDLKPANIKVRDDGTVKVLDFGLAKVSESANTSSLSMSPTITSPAMMTGGGVILGTAAYMSPEQAKGKAVDKRTDIWAFGCVCFEMLTGARAFEGEDVSETMASILRAEPDWKLLSADVPEQTRVLIRRCLEKDRAKRLADFSVVQFLMNEVLPAAPVSAPAAPSVRPLWRRAIPFSLAAIIAGAVVAGIAYYVRPSPEPRSVTRFSFALGEGQQFTNGGRQLVAISPDGTQMVYVANSRLWLRSMSDADARPIPGTHITQGFVNPVFSPDGQSVAFWSLADQTLKRIAVTGGPPVTICAGSTPFGVSWGDDGILFGQGAGGIMRVSPNGGKPERLATMKNDELAHGPQMLPGGQFVLFTVATGTSADRWDKAQIVVQSLTSGERTTLIESGSDARYLPTGHLVYALSGVLYAVPFDLGRLQVMAGPVPVLEGIRRAGFTGTAQFSVARSGSLMFIPGPAAVGSQQSALALFDGKGGAETLKLPPGVYSYPRISPDGRYVAFGNDDGKEGSIWIAELSGASQMRRLTFGGNNQQPIWSSDGQRVAFHSDRDGDEAIFWQRADGTDTAERLTRAEKGTRQFPRSWSLDGTQFLFEAVKGSSVSLWTLSLQDRKSMPIAGVQSSVPLDPMFSPDGRWIAYQSNETGTLQIYVQPFPSTGAKYQITKSGGSRAVWSPDGRRLFYFPTTTVGQFAVVTVATQPSFTFGNPEPLQRGWLETFTGTSRVYDILPDGKRFIAVVPAGELLSGPATTPQINVVLNWFEELKAKVPAVN